MSVQIEKNTTKTPSPPLGEKERKGPRQTPDDDDDDDDVDVERRATMMMNLKKNKSRASSTARNRPNANSTTHPSRTPLKVNVSMDSNTTFWCSFSELANFFYL